MNDDTKEIFNFLQNNEGWFSIKEIADSLDFYEDCRKFVSKCAYRLYLRGHVARSWEVESGVGFYCYCGAGCDEESK